MGIWQKRMDKWARWWNTQIKVNPTHVYNQNLKRDTMLISLISCFHLNLSQKAHVCVQHLNALLCPNAVVPFELGPVRMNLLLNSSDLPT